MNMLENKSDLYSIKSVKSSKPSKFSQKINRVRAKVGSTSSSPSMHLSRTRKTNMANYMKSTKSKSIEKSRKSGRSSAKKRRGSSKVLYLNKESHNRIISIPLNNLCFQDQRSRHDSSKSRNNNREEYSFSRNES